MANDSDAYVPFSRRTGLDPIPPQLKLGEVSAELRRLIFYYISLEIGRESYVPPYGSAVFKLEWRRVATDLHVLFFKQPIDKFDPAHTRPTSALTSSSSVPTSASCST